MITLILLDVRVTIMHFPLTEECESSTEICNLRKYFPRRARTDNIYTSIMSLVRIKIFIYQNCREKL